MTQPSALPIDDIVASYESGQNTVQLGAKYDVSSRTIRKHLLRAGVVMRPPHRGSELRYDDAWIDDVVKAYLGGETMDVIAVRLGVGRGTVWRALTARAVTVRPHGLRASTVTVPSNPVHLGYLAGLLDGEGNLQMRLRNVGRIGGKMAIYSTTAEVMDWLIANVGGKVRWDHKRTERNGWKPIGIWEVYRARDVAMLLEALLPHLIIKRETALTIITSIREKVDA